MKLPLAAAGALVLVMAGPALAQQPRDTTPTPPGGGTGQAGLSSYQFRASDIIGEEIENAQGQEVGEIDDLIVTQDNNVLYAVVSVGGFLGIGDRLVAIPYKDLQVNRRGADTVVTYNVTREELKARPEFRYRAGEIRWRDAQDREARWRTEGETREDQRAPSPAGTTPRQ